jgi:hypothetical protein
VGYFFFGGPFFLFAGQAENRTILRSLENFFVVLARADYGGLKKTLRI